MSKTFKVISTSVLLCPGVLTTGLVCGRSTLRGLLVHTLSLVPWFSGDHTE